MAGKIVHFWQSIEEVSTPTGVYYAGWLKFRTSKTEPYDRLHYRLEFSASEMLLSVKEMELEEDESAFFLEMLSEFSRWRRYARPVRLDDQGLASDEGSVAWACSILCCMVIRREVELTAEVLGVLTRPKFGYTFFKSRPKRRSSVPI